MGIPAAAGRKRSRWETIVSVLAWGTVAMSLAAWGALSLADWHWMGTLIAFGPRWALLVPIAGAMAIAAGSKFKVQGLMLIALAGFVVAGPVMGFCVPWRQALSKVQGPKSKVEGIGTRIKILTCNTLGGRAEEGLKGLIASERPDVFVLQEWPSQRPMPDELAEGRHIARAGGILVGSKWPILESEEMESRARKGQVIGLRCELEVDGHSVQLFGLHLLTPRDGLEAVLSDRFGGLDELDEVTKERQMDGMAVEAWMDGHRSQGSGDRGQEPVVGVPMLVAGDLNLTVESTIYRRRFGHLQNAFSTAGWGWGGTKFTRIHSVRIDHVLADDNWRVERCEVGPNVGSDHRPVVAEMVWHN